MKGLFTVLAVLALAVGCSAQVPPATKHNVQLTWTAAVASGNWGGCTTTAPCVYAVYRCSASAATCADTTNTAWAEITTATTRPSGTSYTDQTAEGLTTYYAVETVQGTANSGPSNVAGPLTVPGSPLAPQLGSPTVAQSKMPAVTPNTEKQLAFAPHLRAVLR